MARFAIKRLKTAYSAWRGDNEDKALLEAVESLATDFAKDRDDDAERPVSMSRDDLELICFDYVSS